MVAIYFLSVKYRLATQIAEANDLTNPATRCDRQRYDTYARTTRGARDRSRLQRRASCSRSGGHRPEAGGGGHARAFVLTGSNGDVTVASGEVRRALGLRSTWLTKIGVRSLSRPSGVVAAGTAVTLSGRVAQMGAPVLEQREGAGAREPGPSLTFQSDGTFSLAVTSAATTENA